MNILINAIEVLLENGFMYSLLAMGYYITYTILNFPDLTVEGTVLSGGVIAALMINAGINPYIATLVAFVGGGIMGGVTGILNVKLKIKPLLCGILMSTFLITVNLVATTVGTGGNFAMAGGSSVISLGPEAKTVINTFPMNLLPSRIGSFVLTPTVKRMIIYFVIALVCKITIDLYLKTKNGMMIIAAGNNPGYVSMLGKNPGSYKILGLAIGNGLAGMSGALIAQSTKNANQSMGIGMVVIGLASLIIGISLFSKIKFMKSTTKVILGAVIYQACLSFATFLGVPSGYNKMIMAVLFTLALVANEKLGKGNQGAENA